jgi:hypothetical protein
VSLCPKMDVSFLLAVLKEGMDTRKGAGAGGLGGGGLVVLLLLMYALGRGCVCVCVYEVILGGGGKVGRWVGIAGWGRGYGWSWR